MKTINIKIGIASYEEIKARTMAISRGEAEVLPDDPKFWFPALEAFAIAISDENEELLKMIKNETGLEV